MINTSTILEAARELNIRAAIEIPKDVQQKIEQMEAEETNHLSHYVLEKILENYDAAIKDRRPMCADTGLPRYYAKIGNNAMIEGGMVALEKALRQATADTTSSIPLRPNRVHPFSRKDYNNNVGLHAPSVDYSFEPDADWMDIPISPPRDVVSAGSHRDRRRRHKRHMRPAFKGGGLSAHCRG